MKIFFDTNVYIGEALLGQAAERMIQATLDVPWHIYASPYLLEELGRVLVDGLGFARRLAVLSHAESSAVPRWWKAAQQWLCLRIPKTAPFCRRPWAAVQITWSRTTATSSLDPTESLRIISMTAYHELLQREGLL